MTRSSVENLPLSSNRILLGVTGGIAAYKSPDLVRRLREAGAEVRVVMTPAAKQFITPMTLQAVSAHPVRSDLWDSEAEAAMGHIELARWADRVVVAPATADLMGRMAAGLASDLLTTLVLATEAEIWLAPAMNRVMWDHPAVRDNVQRLVRQGVRMIGPASGSQACGEVGAGRMTEPVEIVAALAAATTSQRALAGRHFLITAGPTLEDIDPVRFLGNRSSGRMGFALAAAAAEAGARVTLVAGPVQLPTPAGVTRVDVRSALEMREQVMKRVNGTDCFVGVAAVADFRPVTRSEGKIKKQGRERWTLEMEPNPDILAEVARLDRRPFVVGFAAETGEVENYARKKLADKNLDMIVANRVGDGVGFDVSDNELLVLEAGDRHTFGPADKTRLAAQLVALIAPRLGGGSNSREEEQ